MQRSKSMLVAAAFGLALGIPLTLAGWDGLKALLAFLEGEGDRLLGGIVVALSVAVLIRQASARRRTPSPATGNTAGAAPGAPAQDS